MTTITIEVPGNDDAKRIASAVRQFRGVARVRIQRERSLERTSGIPSTYAELVEELRIVEAGHDPAACVPHTEVIGNMEKRMAVRA